MLPSWNLLRPGMMPIWAVTCDIHCKSLAVAVPLSLDLRGFKPTINCGAIVVVIGYRRHFAPDPIEIELPFCVPFPGANPI